MENTKTVKAGKFPGRIDEYVVASNATVKDILEVAGIDYENATIRVNGNEVGWDDVPVGNDLVLVAKKIKGNYRK